MVEEGEHLNTEEPMNTQELLNTMVASQNLKSGEEENMTDHNSPTMEGEKKINTRINKAKR